MFGREHFGFAEEIQIPELSLKTERPLRSDGEPMRKHATYKRYRSVDSSEKITIERYFDPTTGRTASVLPQGCVPYRPLPASRLEPHFDQCSGEGKGLDPPPKQIEAGCLRRAWKRLALRQDPLRRAFDQLIPSTLACVKALWSAIRKAKSTLGEIFSFLFDKHNISLLGQYRCSVDWRKPGVDLSRGALG